MCDDRLLDHFTRTKVNILNTSKHNIISMDEYLNIKF